MQRTFEAHPLTALLLGLIGFLVGALILFWDYPGNSEFETLLRNSPGRPRLHLWVLLTLAQVAFWVVAAGALFPVLVALQRQYHVSLVSAAMAALLFVGLVIAPIVSALTSFPGARVPVPHSSLKVGLLLSLAGLVWVPTITGMVLLPVAASTILTGEAPDEQRMSRFLELRGYLQTFLTILGAMIGFSILWGAASRDAVLQLPGVDTALNPPELIVLFGLYATLLLALVYLPAQLMLTATGRALRDHLVGMQSPKQDTWSEWYAKRKNLTEFLELQGNSMTTLQAALSILTPFVSSLVGVSLSPN